MVYSPSVFEITLCFGGKKIKRFIGEHTLQGCTDVHITKKLDLPLKCNDRGRVMILHPYLRFYTYPSIDILTYTNEHPPQ